MITLKIIPKKCMVVLMAFVFILLLVQMPSLKTEASSPRVMISSYEIENDFAKQEDDFTLNMTIENMNDTFTAENIIISGSTENSEIVPAYGSLNQVYVNSLQAGEKKDISFRFHVSKLEQSGNIPLVFWISFVDSSGIPYEYSSTVSIPVVEEEMLAVSGITVANHTILGTQTRVDVNLENQGTGILRDVVMHIVGKGLEAEKSVKIGEMEAQGKNFTESYLDFQNAGQQTIEIYFTYSDSAGDTYQSDRKSYSVAVEENELQPVEQNISGKVTVEGKKSFGIGKVLILLAIVLFLGGTGISLYQSYKRKRG